MENGSTKKVAVDGTIFFEGGRRYFSLKELGTLEPINLKFSMPVDDRGRDTRLLSAPRTDPDGR